MLVGRSTISSTPGNCRRNSTENTRSGTMEPIAVILCVLSLIMTLSPSLSGAATIKGTIKAGDVSCSYAEIKNNSGGGPRGLRLFSCKNKDGNMNLDCYYYPDNPHDCPWYNKNQSKYYNLLAKSAMNNGQPCRMGSISEKKCHKTYPCERGNCM
ncbi:uncharacterized protein LOC124152646 [Haliotis rufescens]|uniref:uncharacterized protein LOC124152646 n=1 Tax=Haliotis rufescens TaxID=6454 RepID=UPI001EB03F4F|nr:uncharacterized protein LOC124152646 [Haliotis rufescens]